MTVDHVRYDKNHEEYLRVGRNLLDDLTRSMALSGIGVGHDTLDLTDGTRIIVSSRNGGNDIEIIPPEKKPPAIPEEKKEEREEEEERFFLAVGAKIISETKEYTDLYLGIWEPDQETAPFYYRIVDNRHNWSWGRSTTTPDEQPLRELIFARVDLPRIVDVNGDEYDDPLRTVRANDRGLLSFVPLDDSGAFLNGYDQALILYEEAAVTDYYTGSQIPVEVISGDYTIKVAVDPSCDVNEVVVEVRIMVGAEGDIGDVPIRVLNNEVFEVTISISQDEMRDGSGKYVIPYGDWRNPPSIADVFPPRCFNLDTLTNEYNPAIDQYGANPHASNYWQGAFIVSNNSTNIRREENLIPSTGFESGTSWRDYEPWARPPCDSGCGGEPEFYAYKSEYWDPSLHLTLTGYRKFVCDPRISSCQDAVFVSDEEATHEKWVSGNFTVKNWDKESYRLAYSAWGNAEILQNAGINGFWENEYSVYHVPFTKHSAVNFSEITDDVKTHECEGSWCLGLLPNEGVPTGEGDLPWWCGRYPEFVSPESTTQCVGPVYENKFFHVQGSVTIVAVRFRDSAYDYATVWAKCTTRAEATTLVAEINALAPGRRLKYSDLPPDMKAVAAAYIQ